MDCGSSVQDGVVKLGTETNNAGGTLGGITNGADLHFRVAVKPVSTIGQAQETSTYGGASTVLEAKGRHDPCASSGSHTSASELLSAFIASPCPVD